MHISLYFGKATLTGVVVGTGLPLVGFLLFWLFHMYLLSRWQRKAVTRTKEENQADPLPYPVYATLMESQYYRLPLLQPIMQALPLMFFFGVIGFVAGFGMDNLL